jgi:isopentenyl diphosphate isomerase/L-lactate dehydrogenase-like FMN-dependent dehydrogenase
VLANFIGELELTMALAGCASVPEIDRGALLFFP